MADDSSSKEDKADPQAKKVFPDGQGSKFAFVCLKENTLPDTNSLDAAFKKWFTLPDVAE